MIILISAPQGSGKTAMVERIVAGRKSHYWSSIKEIPKDTEVIVVDEYNPNHKDEDLHAICQSEKKNLIFRPLYATDTVVMKMPDIILVTNVILPF